MGQLPHFGLSFSRTWPASHRHQDAYDGGA
jgi:hypothetical protein